MRKITLSVAALALATAFATVQASAADSAAWGPKQNGTQCYHDSKGWDGRDSSIFGYWTQCEGATARAARTTLLHHPLRARRDPHNDR